MIGFERETKDHAAGLRNHILVWLAAACYCLLALDLVGREFDDEVCMDLIVFTRGVVKWLTIGASL